MTTTASSGSEPAARGRTGGLGRMGRPSRWTLRSQLVVSMVALFVAVSLAVGAITVVALDRFLMTQLDTQVRSSALRLTGGAGGGLDGLRGPRPEEDGGRPSGDDGPPGLGGGFLRLVITGGKVVANQVVTAANVDTTLTTAQVEQIKAAGIGGGPTSVDLDGQLGTYRLVAQRSLRDPQTYFITGLAVGPVRGTVTRLAITIAIVSAFGLLAVALAGLWLVRANLRPLRRVAATATRVAQLRLDSGEVALAERVPVQDTDRHTEVGQVGAALNDMLDHVGSALEARHSSEQRVRQFVADASHELRTPLSSIRGYAELSRREREPVPPAVAHALGRVESEAIRMTSLVDDLLLLARLDAGRPLQCEPVDVSRLVVDAVSDAHAASRDHLWQLDLPPEPAFVPGDQARLHQVVANLLANARTHTPSGTTVRTAVSTVGDQVLITVEDDGPGVPESLQPNVFHRFARGDASRVRAEGNTGLGLSIVQAVAHAHGGRVGLDSRPGRTRFSVSLPAA